MADSRITPDRDPAVFLTPAELGLYSAPYTPTPIVPAPYQVTGQPEAGGR